jgi:hypothetical protein
MVPYSQGIEPGGVAYVKSSSVRFLRASCIDGYNMNHIPSKIIYLNPRYHFKDMLDHLDVLLCKDANIGDSCLFIRDDDAIYTFSSGVVKLNFKSDKLKYYCLALLNDDYFLQQLDSMTPRGATIRHAGERFLDCLIPLPGPHSEWVFSAVQHLVKNIAYSEHWCHKKTAQTVNMIDTELMVNHVTYIYPSVSQISATTRVDAAIYSPEVHALFENIQNYSNGNCSLKEFGFDLKRGPNMAKRDLGRSIKSPTFKKKFNVLIYPSDISEAGYLLRSSYLGARNPIWFLEIGNILFAAEGTVGKTFIVCNKDMRFTTNFHGTIIYPIASDIPIIKSVFLGQFLNYLRLKGIFFKLAVGGQGGSFALGYWDTIRIPNFPDYVLSAIYRLYHAPRSMNPFSFDQNNIAAAGIFELNEFRILCKSILEMICFDIKSDTLKPDGYYQDFARTIISESDISKDAG